MSENIEALLREVLERLTKIETAFNGFISNCQCKDHEQRIRKMEDKTTILWTVLFIGGGIIGWAVSLWIG